MLVLLDIYPAGEKPIEGVSSDGLYKKILQSGYKNAVRAQSKDEAVARVLSQVRERDVVLTLGAGDVWKTGEEILKRLKEA